MAFYPASISITRKVLPNLLSSVFILRKLYWHSPFLLNDVAKATIASSSLLPR